LDGNLLGLFGGGEKAENKGLDTITEEPEEQSMLLVPPPT